MSVIALKIDVSKIDKNKLYQGQKGTYLDAVLFLNDEPDQYGQSGMITQSVSKEERAQGVKGAILGNCKILSNGNTNSNPRQPSQADNSSPSTNQSEEDDLPW